MTTRVSACILSALLLTACGGQPERQPEPEPDQAVPELTLNLPSGDCLREVEQTDYTFLEKGFNALENGEYLESLQYFQRYQRIEKTQLADVEARIAIAYLSILPNSPILDRDAARVSYADMRNSIAPETQLHGEVLLMKDSLETFLDMYQQIEQLKRSNGSLREEVEKREEAIKRLRDLTLGREPEPGGLLGK
ncbi:MAG: hypothetical protein ABJ308_00780 [Halieaceae bacterium]